MALFRLPLARQARDVGLFGLLTREIPILSLASSSSDDAVSRLGGLETLSLSCSLGSSEVRRFAFLGFSGLQAFQLSSGSVVSFEAVWHDNRLVLGCVVRLGICLRVQAYPIILKTQKLFGLPVP
jgi:hypothetical protein